MPRYLAVMQADTVASSSTIDDETVIEVWPSTEPDAMRRCTLSLNVAGVAARTILALAPHRHRAARRQLQPVVLASSLREPDP